MSNSSSKIFTTTAHLSLTREKRLVVAALAAAALSANKTALFDALTDAGITEVIVVFDGADDSGQIESLTAYAGERAVALPATTIVIHEPSPDATGWTEQAGPLAEAIEAMAYDFLGQDHEGWEDNDGAYGTFTFAVAERSIQLVFNARFKDTFLTEQTY